MILKEEYVEADSAQVGYGIGFAIAFLITSIFVGARLDPEESTRAASWGVAVIGSGLPMIGCAVGLIRCRRIIRAWRDQKRLKMIQDEMQQDGDA